MSGLKVDFGGQILHDFPGKSFHNTIRFWNILKERVIFQSKHFFQYAFKSNEEKTEPIVLESGLGQVYNEGYGYNILNQVLDMTLTESTLTFTFRFLHDTIYFLTPKAQETIISPFVCCLSCSSLSRTLKQQSTA